MLSALEGKMTNESTIPPTAKQLSIPQPQRNDRLHHIPELCKTYEAFEPRKRSNLRYELGASLAEKAVAGAKAEVATPSCQSL